MAFAAVEPLPLLVPGAVTDVQDFQVPDRVHPGGWIGSRVTGNMGAIGTTGGTTATGKYGFPFMTAEMGGGIEDTYHRRPVLSPDDVAAMMPVMLESGGKTDHIAGVAGDGISE